MANDINFLLLYDGMLYDQSVRSVIESLSVEERKDAIRALRGSQKTPIRPLSQEERDAIVEELLRR